MENFESVLQLETFGNFLEFKRKISLEPLPNGFITSVDEHSLKFYFVEHTENVNDAPKLLASVIVDDALQVKTFVFGAAVPRSVYKHLLDSDTLKSTTELTNLLTPCKSLCEGDNEHDTCCISLAISLLDRYIEAASENLEEERVPMIRFLAEQLKLAFISKNERRYSSQTITTAFLWQLTSTCLYKKLRQLLILPSISLLRKLSADLNVQSGTFDRTYLVQRSISLSQHERIVVLMLDEVYAAQRVEYSNGAFVGLTETGIPAKTVLTFMIQSICGKFKNVVCLVPVDKLDTQLLKTWFHKVMESLDDIFHVVAVSADNHVCNR